MNIRIDSRDSAPAELFFRTADRMRIDGCVNALTHEGLSLALSCAHDALLDHYAQILLQRLRSTAPEMAVEVYFPTNTESLINRFNEALASQSVRQATRSKNEVSSAQLWLVHDAQQLPEQELQLLARLIQNFPGANIRAVLLMAGPAPTQEALSAFGRKLLRWDIEGPTDEQVQAALELANHQGQSEAMTLLLRRMGKLRASVPARAVEPVEPPTQTSVVQAPSSAPDDPPPSPRKAMLRWQWPDWHLPQGLSLKLPDRPALTIENLRRRGPLLGAAAGALALSVLLMMWIQPASFGLKGKGRTVSTEKMAGDSAQSASNPLTAQTSITSVSAAAVPSVPDDIPDPAAEGQAWVRSLPLPGYLIQYGNASTYNKALQLTQSYPALREARIVAAYRPGEKLAHFVVVSEPYESNSKAQDRISRKDLPGNSWVRSIQSLQLNLAPSAPTRRTGNGPENNHPQ